VNNSIDELTTETSTKKKCKRKGKEEDDGATSLELLIMDVGKMVKPDSDLDN
jgi:hypothetical protein